MLQPVTHTLSDRDTDSHDVCLAARETFPQCERLDKDSESQQPSVKDLLKPKIIIREM